MEIRFICFLFNRYYGTILYTGIVYDQGFGAVILSGNLGRKFMWSLKKTLPPQRRTETQTVLPLTRTVWRAVPGNTAMARREQNRNVLSDIIVPLDSLLSAPSSLVRQERTTMLPGELASMEAL